MALTSLIQSTLQFCKKYPYALFAALNLISTGLLLNAGLGALKDGAKSPRLSEQCSTSDAHCIAAFSANRNLNIWIGLIETILGAAFYYLFCVVMGYRFNQYAESKQHPSSPYKKKNQNTDEEIYILSLGMLLFIADIGFRIWGLVNLRHYALQGYSQNCTTLVCRDEEDKSRIIKATNEANGFLFALLLFGFFASCTPGLLAKCCAKEPQANDKSIEDDNNLSGNTPKLTSL